MAETATLPADTPKYRRALLKLSGEALMGTETFGLHGPTLHSIAEQIRNARALGTELCVVIGGGNIFRGLAAAASGMERSQADYMGMLATVMNALGLQAALEQLDLHTRVQSAIPMDTVCEPYIRRRAIRHLEKGRIVIFAAGTGNPYFTTDTAAALRAMEMDCDAILKGTQVDGVYDSDPRTNPSARRFDTISYQDVLTRNLKVMDASAVALARDNALPIVVFSLQETHGLTEVLSGRGRCTRVGP